MVSQSLSEQLKWFTRKLIEIRVREIDGYHAPIVFDPAVIRNCVTPSFDTANTEPKEHIIRMLNEIRGEIVKRKLAAKLDMSFKTTSNRHIEIDGYTTELLRIYFEEYFEESSSFFKEGKNEKHKIVLVYIEQPTDITLGRKELAVFQCLLRNFNKDMSYWELFSSIRNQENLIRGESFPREESRLANAKEKETVRSAVNALEEKLKKATGYNNYPEIVQNIRGVGYKMII